MAWRIRVVIRWVFKASNRHAKSIRTISANNMFYMGVALAAMSAPSAIKLFGTLMLITAFLPSSADPLARVPQDRFAIWPLKPLERIALQVLSPLLNPIAWILIAGVVWKLIAWDLWLPVAAIFACGLFLSHARLPSFIRWTPTIPGSLTLLVRKDLRQFATSLDLYCAMLIAVPAAGLRAMGKLPPDAYGPLTTLVVIILSTCAQTLFGLDREAGLTRYKLLQVTSRKILAAKAIAFLFCVLVATAAISPLGGFAGGLAALSAGQYLSVRQAGRQQARWRFRTSSSFGDSLIVMIPAILGTVIVTKVSWLLIVPIAMLYAASLWLSAALMYRDQSLLVNKDSLFLLERSEPDLKLKN